MGPAQTTQTPGVFKNFQEDRTGLGSTVRKGARFNSTPLLAEIIGPDILIILALVLLLFGGSRLPKLARSLGAAKKEFEHGLGEGAGGAVPDAAPPPERQRDPAPG
jgi:sec-independent protein translocase protein TatA